MEKCKFGFGDWAFLRISGKSITQVYLLINNSEKIVSQRPATAGKTCLRKAGAKGWDV
jgi:hypothetical protein